MTTPGSGPAPDLLIRLKRHPDGSASLTCVRRDGSTTWQRQRGQLGDVFPPHDLTHYAVETTLGYARGFFGLLAEGWEIADFARPWPRGPIPVEAREVELLVGVLDMERLSGTRWSAAEFNEHAARSPARAASPPGPPVAPRPISADELEAIRTRRSDLLRRWSLLAPGEAMELPFTRGSLQADHRLR